MSVQAEPAAPVDIEAKWNTERTQGVRSYYRRSTLEKGSPSEKSRRLDQSQALRLPS